MEEIREREQKKRSNRCQQRPLQSLPCLTLSLGSRPTVRRPANRSLSFVGKEPSKTNADPRKQPKNNSPTFWHCVCNWLSICCRDVEKSASPPEVRPKPVSCFSCCCRRPSRELVFTCLCSWFTVRFDRSRSQSHRWLMHWLTSCSMFLFTRLLNWTFKSDELLELNSVGIRREIWTYSKRNSSMLSIIRKKMLSILSVWDLKSSDICWR